MYSSSLSQHLQVGWTLQLITEYQLAQKASMVVEVEVVVGECWK